MHLKRKSGVNLLSFGEVTGKPKLAK